MLAPSEVIPFAVIGASLMGSGHCIAMCGGLVLSVAQTQKSIATYHLGRLIGYCSLGALGGALGKAVFRSSSYFLIPWISTFLFAAGFIFLGIRLWSGRSIHLFRLPLGIWNKLSRLGPGMMGALSAFLPCGWLHVFILGAMGTQSASLGALYLFFFWLGTLPALSLAPLTFKKILQPMTRFAPRFSAALLITIGVFSLGAKIYSQLQPQTCHKTHSLEP